MVAPARTGEVLLRATTIGVEIVLGISAVYGGVGLLTGAVAMPDTWLEGTPLGSGPVPGLALLLLLAVPMIGAIVAEVNGRPRAPVASASAGLLQVGWIAVELLVMHGFDPLQPVVLALATVLLAAVGLRLRSWP